MRNRKVGVLFSAGIDSTVQIAMLKDLQYDVYPITFDDDSARTKMKQDVAMEFWLSYWDLYAKRIDIRYMRREELRFPNGYVAGWKLTMIMNAMAYCDRYNLRELHLGYLRDDAYAYADETPEAYAKVVDLYNEIYGTSVALCLSLSFLNKADVVKMGAEKFKLPLEKTFSCREVIVAGLTHCGECDVCLNRAKAFVDANVEDKSYYVTKPKLPDRDRNIWAGRQERAQQTRPSVHTEGP